MKRKKVGGGGGGGGGGLSEAFVKIQKKNWGGGGGLVEGRVGGVGFGGRVGGGDRVDVNGEVKLL